MFSMTRWSLPWACLFTECFTSSCALSKENYWKEKRIWIEMRFCSYFTRIPSALGHKVYEWLSTTEDIPRVSAHKERRVTLAHNFRGAKPWSTGLYCFGSGVRLYFMAEAHGRMSEPLVWWVWERWERERKVTRVPPTPPKGITPLSSSSHRPHLLSTSHPSFLPPWGLGLSYTELRGILTKPCYLVLDLLSYYVCLSSLAPTGAPSSHLSASGFFT